MDKTIDNIVIDMLFVVFVKFELAELDALFDISRPVFGFLLALKGVAKGRVV